MGDTCIQHLRLQSANNLQERVTDRWSDRNADKLTHSEPSGNTRIGLRESSQGLDRNLNYISESYKGNNGFNTDPQG